jgi:hypothetical protein
MKVMRLKGVKHIAPVSNENHPSLIKDVKSSPFPVSCTRFITAVPVMIKQRRKEF